MVMIKGDDPNIKLYQEAIKDVAKKGGMVSVDEAHIHLVYLMQGWNGNTRQMKSFFDATIEAAKLMRRAWWVQEPKLVMERWGQTYEEEM